MTSTTPIKETCLVCNKRVYYNEKVSIDHVPYHADCFRCQTCRTRINPVSYGKMVGQFYCKTHFEVKKREMMAQYDSFPIVEKRDGDGLISPRYADVRGKSFTREVSGVKIDQKPVLSQPVNRESETKTEVKTEEKKDVLEGKAPAVQENDKNDFVLSKLDAPMVEEPVDDENNEDIGELHVPVVQFAPDVQTPLMRGGSFSDVSPRKNRSFTDISEIVVTPVKDDAQRTFESVKTPGDGGLDKLDALDDLDMLLDDEKVSPKDDVEGWLMKEPEKTDEDVESWLRESTPVTIQPLTPRTMLKNHVTYETLMECLFDFNKDPLFKFMKYDMDRDQFLEGVINYCLINNLETDLLNILERSVNDEVQSTLEFGTLFRANSVASKLMKYYSNRVSQDFLQVATERLINNVLKNPQDYEIDPSRAKDQDSAKNTEHVANVIEDWLDFFIETATTIMPYTFRLYCRYLWDAVGEKFPDGGMISSEEMEVRHIAVSGFVILRLISPVFTNPEANKIKVDGTFSDEARRFLMIVTKVIQNLGNGVTISSKEVFMHAFSPLIKKQITKMRGLFETLASTPDGRIEAHDNNPKDMLEFYHTIHRSVLASISGYGRDLRRMKKGESNALDCLVKILESLPAPPEKVSTEKKVVVEKIVETKRDDNTIVFAQDDDRDFFEDFGYKRKQMDPKEPEKAKKDKSQKSEEKMDDSPKQEVEVKEEKSAKPKFGLTTLIKGLISKSKKRFQEDGFDLDLSYITPQIIAMGYPFQGLHALVRNSMADVIEFMELKHKDKYMVYNLCAERFYDSQSFKGRVDNFGFEDHNPPPLMIMRPLCMNIHNWLSADSERVAAIHCKAGKGRTGTIIAAYFLHAGTYKTSEEALEFFGKMRTKDGKGVTIPSQIRYVKYYQTCMKNGFPKRDIPLTITEIKWNQCPYGGVSPNLKINVMGKEVFNLKDKTEIPHLDPGEDSKQIPVSFKIRVSVKGDFKVVFTNLLESHEKYFHFWLNTNMIEGDKIVLQRHQLDTKGFKKLKFKRWPSDFMVVIKFEREIVPLAIPM